MVALLAKDKVDAAIVSYVPKALYFYGAGVAVSTVMLIFALLTAEHWSDYWLYQSYERDKESARSSLFKGQIYNWLVYVACVLAIVVFLVGGYFVAQAAVGVTVATCPVK